VFKHLNSIFHAVLLTIFVYGLVACGGGGGGGTPPPPASDKAPPFIVVTMPASEQIDIKTSTFIDVTFNEAIGNVGTNQVEIYPFDADGVISTTRVKLQTDPFIYNVKTNTLTIKPEVDALQLSTKYEVTISGVKDLNDNKMVGSCQWQFGTIGLAGFGIGNTGKCNTVPEPDKPGVPKNVNAVGGNNIVTLNWLPPSLGGTPSFYVIEKSIDNGQNFEVVKAKESPTVFSYIDSDVQNGTSYIYRVTAGNDLGKSDPVESKAVIPNVTPGIPGALTFVEGFIETNNSILLRWGAPTTGGTVSYYIVERTIDDRKTFTTIDANVSATSLSITDSNIQDGIAYKYSVRAASNDGVTERMYSDFVVLGVISLNPVIKLSPPLQSGINFGDAIAFSPDGTTLAIGDPYAANFTGIVYLYIKSGADWNLGPMLTASTSQTIGGFGSSVNFSSDSLTLVVGNDADLRIFTKKGTTWNTTPNRGALLITGNNSGSNASSGATSAFNTNSTMIAVGSWAAQSVNVYTFNGTNWVSSQMLSSQAPIGVFSGFGSSVAFSSDQNTLAVGDIGWNLNFPGAGSVQLFVKSASKWVYGPVLSPDVPSGARFGDSLIFSSDGNSLAIMEKEAKKLHIFSKSGLAWNRNDVLYGAYGATVLFSPDGSRLIVGAQIYSKVGTKWTQTNLISPVARYPLALASAISKDGLTIAVGYGDTVGIYNSSQFK